MSCLVISARAAPSATIRNFVSINSLISDPDEGYPSERRSSLSQFPYPQEHTGSPFVPSAPAEGTTSSLPDHPASSGPAASEGSPGFVGDANGTSGVEDEGESGGGRSTLADETGAGAAAKKAKKRKERDREPLRSSIACQRCRTSKIRCNNNGDLSAPCPACVKSGRECIFPEANPPAKRSHEPGAKPEPVAAERKRFKQTERDSARLDDPDAIRAYAEEVLAAQYLNETVWAQVFDIYKLHYATELPFLHLATLKSMVRKAKHERPHEINLVLLGVLALSTRFHPSLISYVSGLKTEPGEKASSRPSAAMAEDASNASLYFVDALIRGLGNLRGSMAYASVERVQAYLILSLYEWTQSDPGDGGLSAWMFAGIAIRMAHALGLGLGDRPGRPWSEHPELEQEDATLLKEVKRRTMFSCLILDRLLGSGDSRVPTVRAEDLQIQLPCPDVMFDLRGEGYTGFLRPRPDDRAVQKTDISVMACFLRLLDIWSEVSRWSLEGGRRTEQYPPWYEHTNFFRLRSKLDGFYQSLPGMFKWSATNYDSHENHGAASTFVSLHMLGAACRIVLHREYLPFIPLRCTRPSGPLDEADPSAARESYGFWDDSAAEVFHAASVITSLVDICRDKLPISSIVLFAVWVASFMGVYASSFPHMDSNAYMIPHYKESSEKPGRDSEPAKAEPARRILLEALARMSLHLKIAGRFLDVLKELECYYAELRQEDDGRSRHLTHQPKRSVDAGQSSRRASNGAGYPGGGEPKRPSVSEALVHAARSALEQTGAEAYAYARDGARPDHASAASDVGGGSPPAGHDGGGPRRFEFGDIRDYVEKHQARRLAEGPWSVNALSNPGAYHGGAGIESLLDL